MTTYRVGRMPGNISSVDLPDNEEGHTVADILAASGLDHSGYDIRANGTNVTDLGQTVAPDTNILLFKKVKGN